MLKAVLFDLDGTLLDTATDFTAVLNTMLAAYKREPQHYSAVRQQVSNGARAVVTLGFGCAEGDDGFDALVKEFLDRYEQALSVSSCLFPGMDTALAAIETRGLRWGIVTNKPSRFTLPLLKALALDSRCATAICPDHVTHRKPHPEPMLLACNKLGIRPDEAIYLGDHIRDIESGRAAGMPTVACRYGYIPDDERIEDWRADHIIDHPQALTALLDQLT